MNPDKLFDYLDGKLSPADRQQLEEKLLSDAQLRRQFEIAREIHRSSRDSREVITRSDDPEVIARSGALGRKIAVAAAVLVLLNVFFGLAVIANRTKKNVNARTREPEIRQQITASLGAAAKNAMPPPSFEAAEIAITAPRAQWEEVAGRVVAAAAVFGGSAARALPDEKMLTIVADIPSSREAEFREAVSAAATISPMPAVAPATAEQNTAPNDEKERTIVQVRIAEAAR
jgi:hypothetical protein